MGIDTFVQSAVPVGKSPPGWQYTGPFGNQVYIRAMECARISAFPLERGPVRVLFEGHQNFTAPATCQDSTTPRLIILSNVITDSPDLAKHLNSNFGMPSSVAEIKITDNEDEVIHVREWSWTVAANTSTIEVSIAKGEPGEFPYLNRWVWFNTTTLWWMDLNEQDEFYAFTGLAKGNLRSPMIWASTGTTHYTGEGNLILKEFFEGEVVKREGFGCVPP